MSKKYPHLYPLWFWIIWPKVSVESLLGPEKNLIYLIFWGRKHHRIHLVGARLDLTTYRKPALAMGRTHILPSISLWKCLLKYGRVHFANEVQTGCTTLWFKGIPPWLIVMLTPTCNKVTKTRFPPATSLICIFVLWNYTPAWRTLVIEGQWWSLLFAGSNFFLYLLAGFLPKLRGVDWRLQKLHFLGCSIVILSKNEDVVFSVTPVLTGVVVSVGDIPTMS